MSKKKILMYTCSSGGGHIEAWHALAGYLDTLYDVKTKWLFDDTLTDIDLVRWLSSGHMNCNNIYNFLAPKKLHDIINLLAKIGFCYFKRKPKKIEQALLKQLKEEQPDLVISVAPILDGGLLNACKKLNIPFLLIPTDLNPFAFTYDINNPDYQKFRFSLAFDLPELHRALEPVHLKDNLIALNGFPIKKNYFEPINIHNVKQEFAISDSKKVILVMMGARSADTMIAFAKQLLRVKHACHIIFACGKNKEVADKLKQHKLPPHISTTILGYVDEITKIYRISDLYIGKAGTVSFCENLYCNMPMILDATSSIMLWEQINHKLLKKYAWGTSLKQLKDLPHVVNRYLSDEAYYKNIKSNLQSLKKPRFDINIMHLVDQLLKMQ